MKWPTRIVIVTADKRGHYIAKGKINGRAVKFLVDTGATNVSLPESLAGQLGLSCDKKVAVSTANGVIEVCQTRLEQVSVGSLACQDVVANFHPGSSDEVLLGMSFLKHFRLKQTDGQLHIQSHRSTRWLEYCISHGLLALLGVIGAERLSRELRQFWPIVNEHMVNASMWLALHSGAHIEPATWNSAFVALGLGLLWGGAFWAVTIWPEIREQQE